MRLREKPGLNLIAYFGEWSGGVSPPDSLRTVLETFASYGSHYPIAVFDALDASGQRGLEFRLRCFSATLLPPTFSCKISCTSLRPIWSVSCLVGQRQRLGLICGTYQSSLSSRALQGLQFLRLIANPYHCSSVYPSSLSHDCLVLK